MPKPVFPIVPPYTPELLPVVQHAVENILLSVLEFYVPKVFEYGSGNSTLWFARFANVVTVEHDEDWYGELVRALEESKKEVDHHLASASKMPRIIKDYGMFDLVLVDCASYQRNQATKAAMPHVTPGGWLLLDDSHWPQLEPSRNRLKDWPCTIVRGPHLRHTGVTRYHQTSMYQRSDGV